MSEVSHDIKLAIDGGEPAKSEPYGTGQRFGEAEAKAAYDAVMSQKLWMKQGGTRVLAAEKTACDMWSVNHAICCSSGTAAVHTALAAVGVEAGDEVIVNPLSDWGSVAGILALGAIPVFADIDEQTYSLDPAKVEEKITDKTRAIEVVHISGYPARVLELKEIAQKHGIKLVEDCAQSHHAQVGGQFVGTIGDVGAFSTNDSKLISCGEGGLVITNDDEVARVARLFIDKSYERNAQRGQTDVNFVGYNFRLSELAAAVLDVQLKALPEIIDKRRAYTHRFFEQLGDVPGYKVLRLADNAQGSYWFILAHLELDQFKVGRKEIAQALSAEGIPVWPALNPARTLYGTTVFQNGSLYAYNRNRGQMLEGRDYGAGLCPVAEKITDCVLPMFCSPFYTMADADQTAQGVRKVLMYYRK